MSALLSICFYWSLTSDCLTCFLSFRLPLQRLPSLICFFSCSVIHSHFLSLTHTNTCTCAHIHACVHTHTHTHTLSQHLSFCLSISFISVFTPPPPLSLFVSLLHSHFLCSMQTTCVQQAHTSMGNMLTAGSEHVATEPASQVNSARGGLWFGRSWPVPLVGRTAAIRAVLAVHVVFSCLPR